MWLESVSVFPYFNCWILGVCGDHINAECNNEERAIRDLVWYIVYIAKIDSPQSGDRYFVIHGAQNMTG